MYRRYIEASEPCPDGREPDLAARPADAVLEEAGARERRVRLLPSRAAVYFLLAMCLFPRHGYLGVWGKLTAALDGLGLAAPSAKALRDLRRRLGIAPLRLLFGMRAGPLGQPLTRCPIGHRAAEP
jgi:hypothetical protein